MNSENRWNAYIKSSYVEIDKFFKELFQIILIMYTKMKNRLYII